MGYKLAGYDHLGGVELDPEIASIYKTNHNPKYLFTQDLRDFNKRTDLPDELYQLDLLDGSPPCSTFSMAGSREDAWGKEKKFAEGQKLQTLDDLVFVYCDTISKLQPKTFILENVSGMLKGNAKAYTKAVVQRLKEQGYVTQIFLLNGATMGLPQMRERAFIIGHKRKYNFAPLQLKFDCKPITFGQVRETLGYCNLTEFQYALWKDRKKSDLSFGDVIMRKEKRLSMFTNPIIHDDRVAPTITSRGVSAHTLYAEPRRLSRLELCRVGSFPTDYIASEGKLGWLVGMSVPPLMAANISYQINKQWLSKIE